MTLTILLSLLFSIPSDLSVDGFSEVNYFSELAPLDYFDPEEYYMNPGDKIWIAFPDGLPFSGSEIGVSSAIYPISLNGVLNIQNVPSINTENMTLYDLQNHIESYFARAYHGMEISVGLSQSIAFQLSVTGQVKSPGFIRVNGLTRLSSVVGKAGGLTPTGAITNILVIGACGDSSFYNLNDFFSLGDLSANPLLRRNSRLHIFSIRSAIVIEGAVANSQLHSRRIIEFIPGETARQAIDRVGGVNSNANLDACYIERQFPDSLTHAITFDLHAGSPDILLEAGDRLLVPGISNVINITGQVANTTPIPYAAGMSANYYIGVAGGLTSFARRGGIKLILSNGEKQNIDLTTIVPSGSTIEVSRVPVKFWEEYLTILTSVATIVIAYQSIFSK